MKRILSLVLIFLTLALFFNNAVNWHYHKLPNGMIIEHAHPFNKSASPLEKHNHSDIEFLILELIYYSGILLLLVFSGLILFREPGIKPALLRPVDTVGRSHFTLPLLRAPPRI
jgi:hypothetical protein